MFEVKTQVTGAAELEWVLWQADVREQKRQASGGRLFAEENWGKLVETFDIEAP